MQQKLAIVKNVLNLQTCYAALASRPGGLPGMMLVWGKSGAGKTTAVTWLANKIDAIFVRATAAWTQRAMLDQILADLEIDPPRGGSADRLVTIQGAMAESDRPLIVDEADYLMHPFGNLKMLESLRDLHDQTGVPVILVGMEGVERKIVHRKQFSRRISHWVEFHPLDLSDARTLTDTVCEVHVIDDLLARLHGAAHGMIGDFTVGLARIEAFAKANHLDSIGLDRWGDRPFFLGNRQPGS